MFKQTSERVDIYVEKAIMQLCQQNTSPTANNTGRVSVINQANREWQSNLCHDNITIHNTNSLDAVLMVLIKIDFIATCDWKYDTWFCDTCTYMIFIWYAQHRWTRYLLLHLKPQILCNFETEFRFISCIFRHTPTHTHIDCCVYTTHTSTNVCQVR